VTGDAEAHVVHVVHFENLRHAIHIAVARGARVGTESLDVSLMREVRVARDEMHPNPLTGFFSVHATDFDLGLAPLSLPDTTR
jgi:hypothetical protein